MQRLFLLAAVGLGLTAAAFAQNDKPAPTPVDAQAQNPAGPQQDVRGDLLKQLGLAPDQVRRIRMFNQERRPLMEAAQLRLKEANKALDEAIYADNLSETDVQTRIHDAQLAQAEVTRIRSMNELGIRRVLTPDQLSRFRVMRQRFEQIRENNNKPKPGVGKNQIPQGPLRRALKPNGQRP